MTSGAGAPALGGDRPATSLTLTGDLLDAIARRLGARRFPGVGSSVYDAVPAEHHALLTERLIAAAVARGDFAVRDGRLVAALPVALLLRPLTSGGAYYEIERGDADGYRVTALAEADGAVVWHRAAGAYHRFDLLGTDGDLASALFTLLDPSPGEPDADTRPFRRRRERLAAAGDRPELVPARFAELADGWRATTTVTQVSAPGGAAVALSWLTVVDGGPGRVWLIEPDPDSPDDGIVDTDDPLYAVTPVDPATLRDHLTTWCGATT